MTRHLIAVALCAACGENQSAPSDADIRVGDSAPSACEVAWHDVEIGSGLDDQLWGLALDAHGDVYAGGFQHGVTGASNIDPDGDATGVVMRFDPTGVVRWTAVINSAGVDTIEDIAIDPTSERVFAVGRTSGAFPGFVNAGQFDTVLAVLDGDGTVTRITQTGDERPQHPSRLALGANGELVVAGYDDTYIPSNSVEAWEDGFVASFDRAADFTQTFLHKVPLVPPNRITGVAIDHDGSGAMYISHFATAPPASAGAWVSKLDASGSVVWTTRLSNPTIDVVNAIALSPADELFVTGATAGAVAGMNAGLQDAFVTKLDTATGGIVWAAQAGSTKSDYPTGLGFDTAGNIYISGETYGSLTSDGNQGGLDLFAMKLDATGHWRSSWQAGTSADELATSMVVDRCGGVLVGGYTKGALVKGSSDDRRDKMVVVRATL